MIALAKDIFWENFIIVVITILRQFITKEEISYVQLSLQKNKIYKLWTSTKKISFYENDNKTYNSIIQLDDNMELWHRKLGHFSKDIIKEKLKNINIDENCKVCLLPLFKIQK